MQRILGNFLKGLLLLVPVVVTIWVFFILFVKIDGLLSLPIPGLGFVITIGLVTLVGFLASNILFARVFNYLEGIFTRLPLVKLMYFSIKDLINAFVGEKKSFSRPVAVSMGDAGDIKILGFVTAETLEFSGLEDHVAVYMPQSYNFAGLLFMVPRARISPLATGESAKVMAFIVSGGISKGTAGPNGTQL